jgi:hypothetical protein
LRPYTACVLVRRAVVALALVAATGAGGCSALLSADPTPVPGAAATLTRSVRTPIPTPERSAASPVASASPARVASAASPGPSPAATDQAVSEAEVAQLQRRMEQTVASPDLPGLEALLLDHVSFSTAQGGSVMDTSQAATWLRDHAGSGIKVTRLDRGTQTLVLQVLTDGWPNKDPIQQGQVTFSLRRYDANGRPDEDQGDWKIDVIEAL